MHQIQNAFTRTAGQGPLSEEPADNHSVQVLIALHDIDETELTLKVIRDFTVVNHVFWVRDGEEALDFLLGRGFFANRAVIHRPKLAIVDADLPQIGGLGVIQQVQNAADNHTMPTILLVSSALEVDDPPATIARHYSVIARPMDGASLKQAISISMGSDTPQPAPGMRSPFRFNDHTADHEISVERSR